MIRSNHMPGGFARICCCVAIGLAVAVVMCDAVYFAYWPPRWNHFSPESILSVGLIGALYYASIPLCLLGLIALRSIPGTLFSVALSVSWLALVFLLGARKPWMYYGDFPWWMFSRDFVQPLPVALSIGLAFAMCARRACASTGTH